MKEFSFSARVVKIALSIPSGTVMTYGMIAKLAGGGGQAARSITGILGKAYKKGETQIPFHRIVYSNGTIFSGITEDAKRKKMYKKEGIIIDDKGKILNFNEVLYKIKQ